MTYQEALEAFGKIPPGDKEAVREFYDQRVFPFSLQRFRERVSTRPVAEIAFIPVGLQEFGPALAILGANARKLYLLHSTDHRSVAEKAVMLTNAVDRAHLMDVGDGEDQLAILEMCEQELTVLGFPAAMDVVLDITSSRRSVTGVMVSLGVMRGFRQQFVRADAHEVHKNFFVNETLMDLPYLRAIFRPGSREAVLTLLETGEVSSAVAKAKQQAESGNDLDVAIYVLAQMIETGELSELPSPFVGSPVERVAADSLSDPVRIVQAIRRRFGGYL